MAETRNFTLQFLCPETQKALPVPSDGTAAYVAKHWQAEVLIPCPHCSMEHRFVFKAGFMAGAIDVTVGSPMTLLAAEHRS